MTEKKNCVLYHYYEKKDAYKQNLKHFLMFGVNEKDDYYIAIVDGICSVEIKDCTNIFTFNVENKNYDYGGYSFLLRNFIDIGKYEFFLFVNCSVRGPFIPPCILGDNFWISAFTKKMGDDVAMVGASINFLSPSSSHAKKYHSLFSTDGFLPHVQTPAFALKKAAVIFLIESGFFSNSEAWSRSEVISKYEIRLSRILLERGWNIKSLVPEFNAIDYRKNFTDETIEVFSNDYSGDILMREQYFGRTVHPYEIIFIKTERNLWSEKYLNQLADSMCSELNGSCKTSLNLSQGEGMNFRQIVKSRLQRLFGLG